MMTHRQSLTGIAVLVLWCASSLAFDARAQAPGHPDGPLANPLETQTLDRLSATRDRPLFSPSRHPARPPAPIQQEPVASAPPPPPNVTLFGIVVDDEGARAIVRAGTEKIDRVQIGDDIGGWTVSQIDGRRLVLSLDGRFATFTLFSDAGGKRSPHDADGSADKMNGALPETATQAAEPQSTPSRKRRRPNH